jgi:hypothetical protein
VERVILRVIFVFYKNKPSRWRSAGISGSVFMCSVFLCARCAGRLRRAGWRLDSAARPSRTHAVPSASCVRVHLLPPALPAASCVVSCTSCRTGSCSGGLQKDGDNVRCGGLCGVCGIVRCGARDWPRVLGHVEA